MSGTQEFVVWLVGLTYTFVFLSMWVGLSYKDYKSSSTGDHDDSN